MMIQFLPVIFVSASLKLAWPTIRLDIDFNLNLQLTTRNYFFQSVTKYVEIGPERIQLLKLLKVKTSKKSNIIGVTKNDSDTYVNLQLYSIYFLDELSQIFFTL